MEYGDLISRQAILDRTVNKNSIWNKITDSKGNNLEDILNSIPTAENKGEWINNHTTCDKCGWQMIDDVIESPNIVFFNFCPNCGADMRGTENE